MNTVEQIIESICGTEEKLQHKNIIIVDDISGSTECLMSDGKKVLTKILELNEEFIESNPINNYRLITFSSNVVDIGEIKILDSVAMIPNKRAIQPNGGTYTAKAFEYIYSKIDLFKPNVVICYTDGDTNSTQEEIFNSISALKSKNIKIIFIAVSNKSTNMDTITSQEESRIPGMDVINFASNLIDELIIYNSYHLDIPFQGARKSFVDKNRLKFFDISLPKIDGQPLIYIFTSFIEELLQRITENIGTIEWGSKDRSFKKLTAEIGILLIIFDPINYPEHNSYIINVAQRLSNLVPAYSLEKVIEYFKYGYSCSSGSKPILYTNIEGHVQEAVVKLQAFADSINLLSTEGSISGSNIAISFPINGRCLIIEQEVA